MAAAAAPLPVGLPRPRRPPRPPGPPPGRSLTGKPPEKRAKQPDLFLFSRFSDAESGAVPRAVVTDRLLLSMRCPGQLWQGAGREQRPPPPEESRPQARGLPACPSACLRGYANKHGLIQCHAAITEGHPGHSGALAALPDYCPLATAHKATERTTHSFLVGDGGVTCCDFVREQGFVIEDNKSMMTKQSAEAYQLKGVSNSGPPSKYPGRLGDPSSPGCGLQAVTGDGDRIMCFCLCFHVALLMKQTFLMRQTTCVPLYFFQSLSLIGCIPGCPSGYSPASRRNVFELGIIAMNINGESGAASSVPFPAVVGLRKRIALMN
ncbi:uncharacterized protein M6G45_003321 [Spheniscus humboldti]